MEITEDQLRQLYDYETEQPLVDKALERAFADVPSLLRFLGRYTSWNGFFGSGVAALAGKVGRSRRMFLDRSEPIEALADRSVFVASFFFDAARDEFDDRDTEHRDTHRCLAQAVLKGVIGWGAEKGALDARDSALNLLLNDPTWLRSLNERVREGYGATSPDDLPSIFRAIGYHLGSEVLADREFSLLDRNLREHFGELVRYLETTEVTIGHERHRAYQWIAIHSGHGGGVEAEHFEWAVRGARLAFRYAPESLHPELRRQMDRGFINFAQDHREFFESVHEAS